MKGSRAGRISSGMLKGGIVLEWLVRLLNISFDMMGFAPKDCVVHV